MTPDATLVYTPLVPPFRNAPLPAGTGEALTTPDRRDGRIYRCEPPLQLAVELALATGRPLLLRGDPGSGKSSLAAFVARNLGYRYYETVVTSQTSAQDLLWKFDLVRRLADAQAHRDPAAPALSDYRYLEPGVLWWAFDRASAAKRGWSPDSRDPQPPLAEEPNAEMNGERDQDRAVVLIDELDKADPDVPNALLVPLGSLRFPITDIRDRAVHVRLPEPPPAAAVPEAKPMSRRLFVITTNEERELPPAFLRRCIAYRLEHPKADRLVEIARLHFDRPPTHPFTAQHEAQAKTIADRLEAIRTERAKTRRRLPGTAEFLDAVRACLSLGITVGGATWEAVERATLLKDEGLRL